MSTKLWIRDRESGDVFALANGGPPWSVPEYAPADRDWVEALGEWLEEHDYPGASEGGSTGLELVTDHDIMRESLSKHEHRFFNNGCGACFCLVCGSFHTTCDAEHRVDWKE